MEIKLLSKDNIYLLHENAIVTYGGNPGRFPDTDYKIESILSQQYPVFEHDKYPSIHMKAAMLMYFFTKGHCFIDGNKRVGLSSAITMYLINGYEDLLQPMEGYNKTMEVAKIKLNGTDQIDRYIESLGMWLSSKFKYNHLNNINFY